MGDQSRIFLGTFSAFWVSLVSSVSGEAAMRLKERELEDPDDVLIKAEHRRRELATEQQRQKQESEEGE